MKHAKKSNRPEPAQHQVALLGGSYSLVISAVVLALLIVVNLFVSALPTTATKYDISSTKLYSITSNTKVVVNALQDDITIYWIVQAGEEDDVIENLLGKYESLSDHISVVKRNPDVLSPPLPSSTPMRMCPTAALWWSAATGTGTSATTTSM